jgi:hypothetical protein
MDKPDDGVEVKTYVEKIDKLKSALVLHGERFLGMRVLYHNAILCLYYLLTPG